MAALSILAATGAGATEVAFPKDHPLVTMEVPDTWSVTYTPLGFEVQSPEKNSLIVANVLKRNKATVDAWTKTVRDKMVADGVHFNDNTKQASKVAQPPAQPPAPPPPPAPPKPAPALLKPAAAPPSASSAEAYSFSGAPTLAIPGSTPETGEATTTVTGEASDRPAFTSHKPPLSIKVARAFKGTLGDKPVDIELVLFDLTRTDFFVVEQQSDSTDGRAVAIIKTARAVQ